MVHARVVASELNRKKSIGKNGHSLCPKFFNSFIRAFLYARQFWCIPRVDGKSNSIIFYIVVTSASLVVTGALL